MLTILTHRYFCELQGKSQWSVSTSWIFPSVNYFDPQVAFYDEITGARITDTNLIAKKYLTGWFAIDVVGLLPVNYVSLILETGDSGSEVKALKILRLFRLAKMLRLRKLKETLERFQEGNGIDIDFVIESSVSLLIIVILAHLLACLYYLVGTMSEDRQGNLNEVQGCKCTTPWIAHSNL